MLICHTVYPDGVVCISILVRIVQNHSNCLSSVGQHAPGDDQYGYEDAGERWMPVHTVETIVRLSLNSRLRRLTIVHRSLSVSSLFYLPTPPTQTAQLTLMRPKKSALI